MIAIPSLTQVEVGEADKPPVDLLAASEIDRMGLKLMTRNYHSHRSSSEILKICVLASHAFCKSYLGR